MNIVSNKPTITRKEIEGVLDCLIRGELTMGDAVKNFETSISSIAGQKYSLATNSLTSAYHLSFIALNIAKDDEIIIPSFFDLAPLSALSLIGARPVLVDIEENSLTPSIDQIEKKITQKTKAIVIGHIFGFPAPVKKLLELNIPIVEDISHVIGGINDDLIANVGSIAVASFAPGSLITTGNGGIILTSNSRLFSTMKDYRSYHSKNNIINYDYCLTDFQAAMGIPQIAKLQGFIKRRKEIARIFFDSLKFSPHQTLYHYSDLFVYQSFPIIFDAPADKVESYWKKNKVEIQRPIDTPLHRYLDVKPMDYPNSDRLSNKLYSLPIYPGLTKKEIEQIAKSVAKFI